MWWVTCRTPELCAVLCLLDVVLLCVLCAGSEAWLHSCAVAQVKDVMKNVMAGLQQTNSEKILLSWVRQNTRQYPQVGSYPSLAAPWRTHTSTSALEIICHEDGKFHQNVVKLSKKKKKSFEIIFQFSSSERSLLESSWEWLEFYILINLIWRNVTI